MSDNLVLLEDDDFIYYSSIYTVITVTFAMAAVLSKFLTKDSTFGFHSLLSLITLFVGEPVCQLLLKGSSGVFMFGVACCLVYYVLPSGHLTTADKTVLITGWLILHITKNRNKVTEFKFLGKSMHYCIIMIHYGFIYLCYFEFA